MNESLIELAKACTKNTLEFLAAKGLIPYDQIESLTNEYVDRIMKQSIGIENEIADLLLGHAINLMANKNNNEKDS